MPEEGVQLTPSDKLLSVKELMQLCEILVKNGINKIRLTGGEPSIRSDLPQILQGLNSLRSIGLKELAITSNGLVLHRNLKQLSENGLDAANISLDTLDELKFPLIAKRDGLHLVRRSISEALKYLKRVKLNCVVMKGVNDDEILQFVELARESPLHVRFIEFMPFSGNKWDCERLMPLKSLKQLIEAKYHLEPCLDPSGRTDASAKAFRIDGFMGTIGFISSMTSHFCGSCSRLRLTADGSLKVCLFGRNETSLRDLLRAGAAESEIVAAVKKALMGKKYSHDGIDGILENMHRPMIKIGG